MADLVGKLRDLDARLTAFDDGQRSVYAPLDLSYQHLCPDAQRMYRLLGLHPGPEADLYAATALVGGTADEARRCLDGLVDDHLLQESTANRYRFHDLVRAHAADTVVREETQARRRSAVNSLFGFYRHVASLAMDNAYPYERQRRPRVPHVLTPIPDLPSPATALDWLDVELPNLLAVAQHGARNGWPEYTWHMSAILDRDLRIRGRYRDAEKLHHQALANARAIGHHAAQVGALTGLGDIRQLQGRYEQAVDHFEQALQIARSIGHRAGELDALIGLGRTCCNQVRFEQAANHYRRALQIARVIGESVGENLALTGLGFTHARQGRYEQAAAHLVQALQIARTIGHRHGEQSALCSLGFTRMRQGRYEQAAAHLVQALQVACAIGHLAGKHNALTQLGYVRLRQGRYEQAAMYYQQLLHLAQEVSDSNFQGEAWLGLGQVHRTIGNPQMAISHLDRALTLATEMGQPEDQARAHNGLAHAHHELNQHEQARQHWQQALNILTNLGVNDTADNETTVPTIRAHLASHDQQERLPPGYRSTTRDQTTRSPRRTPAKADHTTK